MSAEREDERQSPRSNIGRGRQGAGLGPFPAQVVGHQVSPMSKATAPMPSRWRNHSQWENALFPAPRGRTGGTGSPVITGTSMESWHQHAPLPSGKDSGAGPRSPGLTAAVPPPAPGPRARLLLISAFPPPVGATLSPPPDETLLSTCSPRVRLCSGGCSRHLLGPDLQKLSRVGESTANR